MFDFLKFKKKKNILDFENKKEIFNKMLETKKEINSIKKKLENSLNDEEENLNERLKKLWKVFEYLQEKMIDTEKGLYIGIGVNLLEEDAKPQPIYISWKTLHSHMGVQGTTRMGKTVFMINNIRQGIKKGDNVVVVDPKGGIEQEVLASTLEEAIANDRADDFALLSAAYPELSDRANLLHGMSNESIASLYVKIGTDEHTERYFKETMYDGVFSILAGFEAIEAYEEYVNPGFKEELLKEEIKKYNEFISSKGLKREKLSEDNDLYKPDAIEVAKRPVVTKEEKLVIPKEFEGFSVKRLDYVFSRELITFRDIGNFAPYKKIIELYDYVRSLYMEGDEVRLDLPKEVRDKGILAINALGKIKSLGENFYTQIGSALSIISTKLSTGPIGSLLCDIRINPITIRLTKENKRVICLIQPFPMLFKEISDTMVKIFLSFIEYIMGVVGATGSSLNSRIHLHIDEAASVMYKGVDSLFSKVGGTGTSIYAYTQSFADWKKALGEYEAKAVMDNMNTQIRLRMNDVESCEIVAKEFGLVKKMDMVSMFGEGMNKLMTGSKEEYIIPPEVVRRLSVGRAAAKIDDKIYVVDLPYYSGPKAKLKMPDLLKIPDLEN